MFHKAFVCSQVVIACLVVITVGSPFKPDGSSSSKPYPNCGDKVCNDGEHCEMVQVQCIRAPCPPIATCVKTAGITCANVRCAGTPCVMVKTCDESGSCKLGPSCQPQNQ
ncbi:hypothetical protein Ocin01_01598 [Orchesella cincta]|uniref:Uncharacterized protein n=1 Tax=Orchesella cincta TaxID=48709 RepID=A0A1D2NIR6_ORCCI|nr:hypothetical protein Ocin01_01598 [Orchesella cincta]